MKIYKLKMSRDCWSSDRRPKRDKTFNSAERWRGKREVAAEMQNPETSQWREKAIKEWYENASMHTINLLRTLSRLDIHAFPDDDELGSFYDWFDFVEASIKLPKGYEWHRGKVEKI